MPSSLEVRDADSAAEAPRRAPFPSLLISADGFEARGSFAAAQAAYLEPDPATVRALNTLLTDKRIGVVAHFYMDAELQGVLAACEWPLIHVADSLQMADHAVQMAEHGAQAILVLGVDFMSENVRALLDVSGYAHVPVYRLAEKAIGCSLAESAEALAYGAYLTKAARTPRSLHVIYVNTSLRVKGRAERVLPTITCTSSNVLRLVLQAFAQVPDLHVWFGPDTYMGGNLATMLSVLANADPAAVAALHPEHTPESLQRASQRFGYFRQGLCIVHEMFGASVVAQVRRDYADAFVTAHFEVPGEMFGLGFEAQQRGRGVVGSTSNILDFITRKVEAATHSADPATLRFVLGTEAGMTTPIAHRVRETLRRAHSRSVVEIVFPVAAEAIAATGDQALPIAPGVAAGEGCSVAGGCATCPYMKMNSLDALLALAQRIGVDQPASLRGFAPATYSERLDGKSLAELGGVSIVRMRDFQRTGKLSDELVAALTSSI